MTTAFVSSTYEGFDAYLRAKTPKSWERAKASQHRARLYKVLNDEFALVAFFQSGSFSNGTGISIHSDVDYIARIPYASRPNSSDTALRRVRDAIKREVWEAKNVYVDRPAVRVTLDWLTADTDIVPAYYEGQRRGQDILLIPGPGGSWLEAAPKAHLDYVRHQDQTHHGGVKGLARLLKGWKYENSIPVSSFYLEMRAAAYGANNSSIYFVTDLRAVMRDLLRHELRDMNDPAGLVNRIVACGSDSDRIAALRGLRTAVRELDAAVEAWRDDEHWEMSRHLRNVLGDEFPRVLN